MAITFDGPNKIITLSSGVTSVTVSEIYSRWKDWSLLTDNAKYFPAFRVVGGDPLGGGAYAGINVFLRNDLGWRIKPPEQDIIINITGNLYFEDPDTAGIISTIGGYDTVIRLTLSANLLQVSGGSGSAPTAQQVATAVWGSATADMSTTGTIGNFISKKLLTIGKFLGLK